MRTDPDDDNPTPAPRVGLVLGGGGAIGAAYHAGALAALENDLGWDPRAADVIVGTSAGAIVGALLRRGIAASDLAALSVGTELLDLRPLVVESLSRRPDLPPMTIGSMLRAPRLPRPSTVLGLARMAASRRRLPLGALSVLLPAGRNIMLSHLTFLEEVVGDDWPDAKLLIAAVRRRDLHRSVFGTRAERPSLSTAVAASCAVPGYFADVTINGHAYVDGGVVSATNADALRHDYMAPSASAGGLARPHEHGHIDLAIVVSPMTGDVKRRSATDLVRRICRRDLDRELRILRRRGIPAVVIEPGPDVLRHMTADFMNDDLATEIVRDAFLDTGAQISASPQLQGLYARTPAPRLRTPRIAATG